MAIRVGVCGLTSDHVWGMGDAMARIEGVEIAAVADAHAELRERATARWGGAAPFSAAEALLHGAGVDAVLACGDNAGKADIVEAAARRHVHVMTDKPMAASLAQADRALAAAEAAGVVYMVAYHNNFSRGFARVREILGAGWLGRVYLARGHIGHAGPREVGCSPYFCEWLFDRDANGGGTFIDEACYVLNAWLQYLGPVAEVSAFTAQIGHRDYLPPEVEDNAVAILRFANGALGVIDSKWGQVGPLPHGASYHGTAGTLMVGRAQLDLYSTTAVPEAVRGWVALPVGPGFAAHEPQGEQHTFIDCIRTGRPVPNGAHPRVARETQAVIEAVYASGRQGRAVPVAGGTAR